jgi:hypothetical protein
VAEGDANSLQIGLGHVGEDLEINGILGKGACVLREAKSTKPSRYLVIHSY